MSLNKNTPIKVLKAAASLKLTVVCLLILAVLVILGTLYQANHGLYQAQQKFFHSWFFLFLGFIPIPGTVLIMFILFFNLLAAIFFRIGAGLSKTGNLIIHMGLLVLLLGGFLSFYFSQESTIILKEGETGNMSSSGYLWEVVAWELKAGQTNPDIYVFDTKNLNSGDIIHLEDLGLVMQVKEYHKNCTAFTGNNASGIRKLEKKQPENEIENNIPGVLFDIQSLPGQSLLLYGNDSHPTAITVDNRKFYFSLRKKKFSLPISLTLEDFAVKFYPNSQIPKSYQSKVKIKTPTGVERDVTISMNKPLRYGDLTFFQSSYYIAHDGTEYTILAVVKNVGRLLPYFAGFIIFLGMAIHFIVMLIGKQRRNPFEKGFRHLPKLLLIFTLSAGLSFGALPLRAEVKSFSELNHMVILENGRPKPLDTFARNILKQFSGQEKFNGKPAIEWLARVLFSPTDSYGDKIFLITNPEVLDSLGLPREGKARDRYSFAQLNKGLPKLRQLAIEVSKINPEERSFIENEIIMLHNKLYIYMDLLESFQFVFLHPDFTVTNAQNREILNLPLDQNEFSFFDLAEKADKIQALNAALKNKNENEWSPGEKEFAAISKHMDEWIEQHKELPLTIIPCSSFAGMDIPGKETEEKWLSPWDLLALFYTHGRPPDMQIQILRDIVLAYHEPNQEKLDYHIKSFNKTVYEQVGKQLRKKAISLEIFYNRLDPFYKAEFFYGFTIIFLLLSFVFLKKWFYRIAFILLTGGLLFHASGIFMRIYIMKRPPVTNLYETFIFTGLITALLGIILELFKKRNTGILTGGLAGIVMLLIAGKYALEGDTMGMLVAVLDSNFWLAAHVITIILGYAGIVLSGFIGHIYLLQKIFRPQKVELLKNTYQAIYAIQAFGIVFTFLGTVLGGIWADQSWGRFWGWDPKENGALLILLWSAILFHARLAGVIKEKGMAFGAIIGVIAVSLAWFGVNLLGVGLHSYGFTTGVAKALFTFVAFEIIFMIAVALILKNKTYIENKK